MKNIDSIFDFYLKNRLSIESDEESKKVFASMIALAEYMKDKNFNLPTVIKMIVLENTNVDKLTNQREINNILTEFHNLKTNESIIAQNCLETANKLNSKGIEEDLNHIYGRLLISVGIDVESNIQLDFARLYEIVIRITEKELDSERETRIKYYYYNSYDVTREYAYLISLLEEILNLKIKQIINQENKNFETKYEEQKRFYSNMPILNGILNKIKKL